MEMNLSFFDYVNLVGKYIAFKYQQFRLATKEYEIVNTSYGSVRGRKRKNLHNEFGMYLAFEGIPYAKKPVGELRFRAPQPAEPWTEVLDCTSGRSKPMQFNYVLKVVQGSEDCLHINVYTKTLKSEKPLPVMVWIFGGGFQIGEASRDLHAPDYLMQRDMVLVTFNYRLGAFGFLCMDDSDLQIPGNAGLKDQVLALKWIKDNIHNFNGDPNNITLFGESAGGVSVHFMMLTPQASGLFHKAIIQSGSALCPWAFTRHHDYCYKLAQHIGYSGNKSDKELYSFLVKQPAHLLAIRDEDLMSKEELQSQLIMHFVPVIEPYVMQDCIADRPFKEMLPTAWGNEIPLIIGANSFEGLFCYCTVQKYPFIIDEQPDLVSLLPADVINSYESFQLKEKASMLTDKYFDGNMPNAKEHLLPFLALLGHRSFWHDVFRTVISRSAYASRVSTYFYNFDFDSPTSNCIRSLRCGQSVRGVCHGDDLAYIFYSALSTNPATSTKEYKCIQRMVAMWYNFALNSNPNCMEIEPVIWEPISHSVELFKCLNISDDLEFTKFPLYDKLRIWIEFYTKGDLI